MFERGLNAWRILRTNKDLPTINVLINLSRAAFVVISALVGGNVFYRVTGGAIPLYIYVAAFLLVLSGLVVIAAVSRNRMAPQWNPDIWVKRRSQVCRVKSKTLHHVEYDLDITCMKDNVLSFSLYIEWTGKRDIKFKLHNRDFRYVESKLPGVRAVAYRIIFDYPRNKDDVLNLRYSATGSSYEAEPDDHFSHTFGDLLVPETAIMAVKFSKGLTVSEVLWQSFKPPNADRPEHSPECVQLDADLTIVRSFHPVSNTRYSFTWRYA